MRDKHRLREKAHSWSRTAPRVTGVIVIVLVLMCSSVAFTPGVADAQATQNWETELGSDVMDIDVSHSDGTTYVSTVDNRLYALDRDGNIMFNVSAPYQLETIVYSSSEDAVYAISNAQTGNDRRDEFAKIDATDGSVITTEAIATTTIGLAVDDEHGEVFVAGVDGTDVDVHSYSMDLQTNLWTTSHSSLTGENELVYQQTTDRVHVVSNDVIAIDRSTETVDYRDDFSGGEGHHAGAASGDNLYLTIEATQADIVNVNESGSIVWTRDGQNFQYADAFSSFVTTSGTVVFDDDGNEIHTANTSSHAVLQEAENGNVELIRDDTEATVISSTLDTEVPDEPLESTGLEIDTRPLYLPGATHQYSVLHDFFDPNTDTNGTENVTANATVTSENSTLLTVNENNNTLTAINDSNVSTVVNVTAEYEGENVTKPVVVASPTVDNLEILPTGMTRLWAVGTDNTMFIILIAAMMAVPATRFANAFAGIATAQMILVIGWLGGYVGLGMAMLSVFVAMFIGLNLAANIDYTVRR